MSWQKVDPQAAAAASGEEDITEALPDYVNRLNSIDTRLLTYIDDAISGNASHANLMELLGIRKEMRLLDSYDIDSEKSTDRLLVFVKREEVKKG